MYFFAVPMFLLLALEQEEAVMRRLAAQAGLHMPPAAYRVGTKYLSDKYKLSPTYARARIEVSGRELIRDPGMIIRDHEMIIRDHPCMWLIGSLYLLYRRTESQAIVIPYRPVFI